MKNENRATNPFAMTLLPEVAMQAVVELGSAMRTLSSGSKPGPSLTVFQAMAESLLERIPDNDLPGWPEPDILHRGRAALQRTPLLLQQGRLAELEVEREALRKLRDALYRTQALPQPTTA